MKIVECMFLGDDDKCYSEFTTKRAAWEIDEETRKRYCDSGMFNDCPRYKSKMEHLDQRTEE